MALHKHLVDKALGEFQPACLILKREKRSALCRDLTNLTFGQQVRQARESAFREAHGQFELKVAFEDVGVVLPFPKGFAINQAPQPFIRVRPVITGPGQDVTIRQQASLND